MAERYDFYVHDNRKVTFNLTEPIMREDNGVTDFVFHIPKVLNELEVSDWAWWLVFVNAKKEKYSIALTLSDDPESPLEKNVATYTVDYAMSIKAGSVQFALEAINTGTGGAIDNEWHTLTYETKVKETLQGNQAEYAETESDIISALIIEVQNKVSQLVGGATPEPVSLIADMTDTKKVYLYVGEESGESTNYWYYYNGSAWVPGGLYSAGIVDSAPTQGSTNAVSSGGVWDKITPVEDDLKRLFQSVTITIESPETYDVAIDMKEGETLSIDNATDMNLDCFLRVDGSRDNLQRFTANKNTKTYIKTTQDCNIVHVYCGKTGTVTFTNESRIIAGLVRDTAGLTENIDLSGMTELGNILFPASGNITYQNNDSRVRSREGVRFLLHKNDVIALTDYTDARFYLGWLDADGVLHTVGWLTKDYIVQQDGQYVFTVSNRTEVTQESADALTALIRITRYFSYKGYYNKVEVDEHIDGAKTAVKEEIQAIQYEYFPGYILSSGAISPDPGTQLAVYSENLYIQKGQKIRVYGAYTEPRSSWVAIGAYKSDGSFIERSVLTSSTRQNIDLEYTATTEGYLILSYRSYGEMFLSVVLEDTIYNSVQQYVSQQHRTDVALRNPNFKSINHRGYHVDAPENTLPAFVLSYKNGFRYVETDVQLTSDGVPVLCHDATVDRTSNGTGEVSSFTYAQIRELDFGSWKSADYAGTKIPSLDEFVELCRNLGLHPYIQTEVTAAIQPMINIIKSHGMIGHVTFLSIGAGVLREIHQILPKARLVWIPYGRTVDSGIVESVTDLKGDNEFVIGCSDIDSTGISACIENDIQVEMYTINTINKLNSLDKYVSGITTDYLLAELVLAEKSLAE